VLALERAYVDSTRTVGLIAAGFLVLGLLASFSLGRGGADDPDRRRPEPAPTP
jgi:hypothetical protein